MNHTRCQWSEASLVWLSSLIWGEVYVHGTAYLGIWNGTNVRLFGVRQAPQARTIGGIGMVGGMGEAVQNVMGGLGWGASPSPTAAHSVGGGSPAQSPQPARVAPSRSNSNARSIT